MRTKRPASPLLILSCLLSLVIFSSCQKTTEKSTTDKVAATKIDGVDTAAVIPENVCSEEFKKLATNYYENEKAIGNLRKQGSDLTQYKERNEKQVENCKAIEAVFKKEGSEACLKKPGIKTKENTIFANDYANVCKAVGLRAKIATKKDNTYTLPNGKSITRFKFTDAAKELLQPGNQAEVVFITNKEIKYGKENFMHAVQDGAPTCYMPSYITTTLPENLTFNYIADINDNGDKQPTHLGFEFNGARTLIALEAQSIYSMLCLNLKLSNESNKKPALEKIFGAHIEVLEETAKAKEEKADKSEERLNSEVAPAPVATGAAASTATLTAGANATGSTAATATPPNPTTAALNQNLAAASAQLKEITDHVIKTASDAGTQNINAARDASFAVIEKAEASAKAVVSKGIADAKDAVVDSVAKPFVDAKEQAKKIMFEPFYIPKKIWSFIKSLFTDDDKAEKKTETRALTQTPASK